MKAPSKTETKIGSINPVALGNYERLVENARLFTPRVGFPKGVYRFKTFEEADEWTERHIAAGVAKKYIARQKKFRELVMS